MSVQRHEPAAAGPGGATGPAVTITTYEDGPLLVRGDFTVLTQDGETVDAGRRTVALCRCGLSARKPFCDGTHKAGKFRAPAQPDPRP